MNAYDKVYLDKARTALGRMLDFAVYDLQYDLSEFWELFIASKISSRFETGDFTVLVGKSGIELAYEVLEASGLSVKRIKPNDTIDRSEEYWCGWALAYFQWATALPFSAITKHVSITEICALYMPYHEMDIRQFCDKLHAMLEEAKPETNLKIFRKAAELSQSELAEITGVPLRTLQQYEQRRKNINKANSEYLVSLSRALACNVQDLMELDANMQF